MQKNGAGRPGGETSVVLHSGVRCILASQNTSAWWNNHDSPPWSRKSCLPLEKLIRFGRSTQWLGRQILWTRVTKNVMEKCL